MSIIVRTVSISNSLLLCFGACGTSLSHVPLSSTQNYSRQHRGKDMRPVFRLGGMISLGQFAEPFEDRGVL